MPQAAQLQEEIDELDPALWYFDVVSPFAYLHFHTLQPLRGRLAIQPVSVLFAGLLKHWGTKGPAEVPPKRMHTYQYCVWAASRLGVPFRMPARHPFNPLAAQRLLIAVGATSESVGMAFTFVFGEGRGAGLAGTEDRSTLPRWRRPQVHRDGDLASGGPVRLHDGAQAVGCAASGRVNLPPHTDIRRYQRVGKRRDVWKTRRISIAFRLTR